MHEDHYQPERKPSTEISFVVIRGKLKLKIPSNFVQRDFCDTPLCIYAYANVVLI